MKKYEKCNVCGGVYSSISGQAMKHIKTAHNFVGLTEYFYSFNKSDLCVICQTNNKRIKNWSFDKHETCSGARCIRTHAKSNRSIAAKKLALSGNSNFQKLDVKEKSKQTRAIAHEKGLLYCQQPENRKSLGIRTTERNLINNPMKNPDVAKKMSESSKGKILSAEHRNNISIGVSKFIAGLTPEEFKIRMRNTEKIYEIDDRTFEPLDLSHIFDNIEFYIQKTKDCTRSHDVRTENVEYYIPEEIRKYFFDN